MIIVSFEKLKTDFVAISEEKIKEVVHYYWETLQEEYEEYQEKFMYVTDDILEELEMWYEDNKERRVFVFQLLRELNEKETYPKHLKEKVLESLQ